MATFPSKREGEVAQTLMVLLGLNGMTTLRSRLIRLAHQNPEARKDILGLLSDKRAYGPDSESEESDHRLMETYRELRSQIPNWDKTLKTQYRQLTQATDLLEKMQEDNPNVYVLEFMRQNLFQVMANLSNSTKDFRELDRMLKEEIQSD